MSPNASPPVTSPSRGAAGAGLGGERGGSGAGLGGERGAGAGLGGERGGAGAGGGGKRGGRGGKKGVLGLILGPIRTPSPSEYYRLGSPGGGGWMGRAGAGGGAGGKVDVRALVQGALEEWRRTEAAAMQQLSTSVLGRGLSDVRKVYQLGKELGRGNFGVIREAVDWVSGERFACKSVNKKRLECVDDIADLRREVEMMRAVKGT
ncbi:unnamed protein product [Closterium sp. NIES-65]|nr:unnamed protein product [Closterium sp. NIES-65]